MSTKWINWIRLCISIASFLVHVNGTSGFLQSSKGLRQGNPLLYLFMLATEVLNCLPRRAREGGYLSGFKVRSKGGEGMEVSHLLFVNDTLVFCGATY